MTCFTPSSIACGLLSVAVAVSAQDDIGYEGMFVDVLEEVHDYEVQLKGGEIPSYVLGAMVQTGPARWSWGGRNMTHALDGFGKLHKFEFKGGNSVFFSTKFLQSGFYQEAQRINDIPMNVMAMPTNPPLPNGISAMSAFTAAPNDNNQVNVIQRGNGDYEVLSDTLAIMAVDPTSMNLTMEYAAMKCGANAPKQCSNMLNETQPMGELCAGATAHPFVLENGDYIGLREIARYSTMEPESEGFAVYRRTMAAMGTVEDIVHIKVPKASYTHAFGMAKDLDGQHHVVIAQQPIYYNSLAIAYYHTLDKGFSIESGNARFFVAPLEFGATAVEIQSEELLFFGHILNTYSPAPGKFVIDINKQNANFFGRFSLENLRNKDNRDSWTTVPGIHGRQPGHMTPTRYEIDVPSKTVSSGKPFFGHDPLHNVMFEQDLYKLHPDDYGKPYCGYWAFHMHYNHSTSFGSQAITRTELCGEKPTVVAAWHRPNVYPGEASFVPAPGSKDKTEGVLIFQVYDGVKGKSSIIVANATSMTTIAEAELPTNIPYTVHGNWFPAAKPSSLFV